MLRHVAEVACAASTSDVHSPFQITPELLLDAVIAADVYGQDYASAWKQRSSSALSQPNGPSVLIS